ncbi:MAG: EAL domain-containing protein [Granulosicoccus sp.]
MKSKSPPRRGLLALLPVFPATLIRPIQLALSIMLLGMGVLFSAEFLGIGADPRESLRQSRTTVAESLAVQLSVFASLGDTVSIDRAVSSLLTRSDDIRAASLVLENGTVVTQHGDLHTLDNIDSASTLTHVSLPIFNGALQWGEVRVVFVPGGIAARELGWFAFVAVFSFISFSLFLGRALIQLDPGRVVPSRVETAFDLFTAGVVILDDKMRIVMVNRTVAQIVGNPAFELTGTRMEQWSWHEEQGMISPWVTTFNSGVAVSDHPLRLTGADGVEKLLSVSCASVGADEEAKGVLVTLDDFTPLEHRNRELSETLRELHLSKEAISLKNQELEILATTDPLTGIANRRTLMERLEKDLDDARTNGTPLSCIMCDIDYFKRINDTLGHAVGDDVIRAVADRLKSFCSEDDTIGRYGGEEFVMVLPNMGAESVTQLAERVRIAVIALASENRLVAIKQLSASFGVAELLPSMPDGDSLVAAADVALYAAKEGGRNRVEIYEQPDPTLTNNAMFKKQNVIEPSGEDLVGARVIELEMQLAEHRSSLDSLREYDMLTGVPMRSVFLHRVETELARAERNSTLVGVMSFELRDLERIIVKFGHALSDAVVVQFVERLEKGLRSTDIVSNLTNEHNLSRITSNEYGVLLSDLVDTSSAMIVVTRLKRLLAQPFIVGDQPVYIGVNIGISLALPGENDAAALFGQAGEARVVASGKPEKISHGFASTLLDDESHDYIQLEADLHDALDCDDLEVWFQPKHDIAEGRITGMEALLRWRHKTRGFVSPAIFIAVAEANGLIGRLSTLVLEKTLQQIVLWRSMGFDYLCVSINVSPMELRAESLVSDTLSELKRLGVDGKQLEVELTETSVLDRPEEAREALQKLRAEGIRISMDDFGTGYTSLALLADLPLDIVKLDRSFIVGLGKSERNRAVVESIITMAHALGLRVVGEGVETEEELEILTGLGCNLVQGYLISRPQPADEMTAFLVQQRAAILEKKRA